jgi:hypothetical protein
MQIGSSCLICFKLIKTGLEESSVNSQSGFMGKYIWQLKSHETQGNIINY